MRKEPDNKSVGPRRWRVRALFAVAAGVVLLLFVLGSYTASPPQREAATRKCAVMHGGQVWCGVLADHPEAKADEEEAKRAAEAEAKRDEERQRQAKVNGVALGTRLERNISDGSGAVFSITKWSS
jgi:hypothetical protein